jgi:F420-dependent oxidoreductase-like protein
MTTVAVQIEPQFGYGFDEIAAIAGAAEDAGWSGLWVSDHLLWDMQSTERNCFEAWTLLAALATTTSTLRLGTLVTCNSYRHPSLLAKMAAGIDVISQGRVDFGLGAGWKEEEYRAYGYPFPPIQVRHAQLAEACGLIRLLWTAPVADFAGEHYVVDRAVCAPKPAQEPMPLWVGGHGDRLLRIVAEHADGWNMVFGRTLQELRDRHSVLDRHCEDLDRDPATVARSVFLFTALVENDRELEHLGAQQEARFGPTGRRFLQSGRQAGLVGGAEQVAASLAAHLELGFSGLHLLFPYGSEVEMVARYTEAVLSHL